MILYRSADLSDSQRLPSMAADCEEIDSEVAQILSLLSIQAALHGRGPAVQPPRHVAAPKSSSFTTFNTLQQAKDALNGLLIESLRPDYNLDGSIMDTDPKSTRTTRVICLQRWCLRLQFLLVEQFKTASPQELRPFRTLHMMAIIAIVLNSTTDSGTETSFDGHLPQFNEIISLAQSIIYGEVDLDSSFNTASTETIPTSLVTSIPPSSSSLSNHRARGSNNSWTDIFTFEMGMIAPIYYTALKCRCPKIREEALDLLSHVRPRREGLWDALLLRRVAQRAITIETSHCFQAVREGDPSTWSLEQHRIHGVMVMPSIGTADGRERVRFTWRPDGEWLEWDEWV